MCRHGPGWVAGWESGAVSGTSMGAQENLGHGGGSGAACCISALWSVPIGDQGLPQPKHTALRPLCLTVPYEQRGLQVLREGSPIAWLLHSIFS